MGPGSWAGLAIGVVVCVIFAIVIINLSKKTKAKTDEILQAAFKGKRRTYTDHDAVYDSDMMHVATPVYDNSKNVIGAVLVSGPMKMRSNAVTQYQKYMLIWSKIKSLK